VSPVTPHFKDSKYAFPTLDLDGWHATVVTALLLEVYVLVEVVPSLANIRAGFSE